MIRLMRALKIQNRHNSTEKESQSSSTKPFEDDEAKPPPSFPSCFERGSHRGYWVISGRGV